MNRDEALQRAASAASDAERIGVSSGRLDALTRLAQAWVAIARELPAAPKPASYLVDGLDPHNFRNDGSDPNQNACTWNRGGVACGYGANAQVHRRMMQPGKNAQPAPYNIDPDLARDVRVCGHNIISLRVGDHWVHPEQVRTCDDPPMDGA